MYMHIMSIHHTHTGTLADLYREATKTKGMSNLKLRYEQLIGSNESRP